MRAEPEPAHVCPPWGHWGAGGCEHAVQPAAAPRGVVPTSAGPQTHWEAPGTQPPNTQAPQPTPRLPSSPLGGWGEVGCSWTGPRLPLCLKTLAYGGAGSFGQGTGAPRFIFQGEEGGSTPSSLRHQWSCVQKAEGLAPSCGQWTASASALLCSAGVRANSSRRGCCPLNAQRGRAGLARVAACVPRLVGHLGHRP